MGLLALGLVGGAAAYFGLPFILGRWGGERPDLVVHKVKRDSISVNIVERGALESADNREIICRVKARSQGSTVSSSIKWVIDDGTHVKQGQLLMELDDSGLQDQLKTQQITRDKAKNDWLQAKENYTIVLSQNESDIQTATIALKLAIIDLDKFLRGDYQQQLKDVKGRILLAESDVAMALDRAAWSERMVRKNYFGAPQAQSDKAKLQSTRVALEKVREEQRVLQEYTAKRTWKDLDSKVVEAERALERVKTQAKSKADQASNTMETSHLVYVQEQAKIDDIEAEIDKCTILAPQDGMVVYYVSENTRWGSGSQQSIVAQGEPVREGQKMMRIPNLNKMLVNTRVHEAMVSRVRGEETRATGFGDVVREALLANPDPYSLLSGQHVFQVQRSQLLEKYRDKESEDVGKGQQASVRLDAFPGKQLKGSVKSVAAVASQTDFMASDVKVYQTMIQIDEEVEGLRPGMSAEVTIHTDSAADDVLTVPVQAIVGTPAMGKARKVYVLTPTGPQEREIVVGLTNDRMAEVKSGLSEGDEVILNPKSLMGDKERIALTPKLGGKGEGEGGGGPDGKGGRGKGKGGAGAGPGGPGPGGPGGPGGPVPGGAGPGGPGPGGPGGGNFDRSGMKDRVGKAGAAEDKPEAARAKGKGAEAAD